MDAIIVGMGTALDDDPLLTARPPGPRTACRVILDSRGLLPLNSQLVKTARQVPTVIVSATDASTKQFEQTGCEGLALAAARAGRPAVEALLDELGRRRWANVL